MTRGTNCFDSGPIYAIFLLFSLFFTLSNAHGTSHKLLLPALANEPTGTITSIDEDEHHLFVSAENGVYRVTGAYSEILIAHNELEHKGYITHVHSSGGQLYISIYGSGVHVYDKQTGNLEKLELNNRYNPYIVSTVVQDGFLAASFVSGFLVYDLKHNKIVFNSLSSETFINDKLEITKLRKLNENNILVSSSSGLIAYQIGSQQISHISLSSSLPMLNRLDAIDVSDDYIYLAGINGVYLLDHSFTIAKFYPLNLPTDAFIDDIAVTNRGDIYISAGNLYKLDKSGAINSFTESPLLSESKIATASTLFHSSHGLLIASSQQGLLRLPPNHNLVSYLSLNGSIFEESVLDGLISRENRILIASTSGYYTADLGSGILVPIYEESLQSAHLLSVSDKEVLDLHNCVLIELSEKKWTAKRKKLPEIGCHQSLQVLRNKTGQYILLANEDANSLMKLGKGFQFEELTKAPVGTYMFSINESGEIVALTSNNELLVYKSNYWTAQMRLSESNVPFSCLEYSQLIVWFCSQGEGLGKAIIDGETTYPMYSSSRMSSFVRDVELFESNILVANNKGLMGYDFLENSEIAIAGSHGIFDSDFDHGAVIHLGNGMYLISGDELTYLLQQDFLPSILKGESAFPDFKTLSLKTRRRELLQPQSLTKSDLVFEYSENKIELSVVADNLFPKFEQGFVYELQGPSTDKGLIEGSRLTISLNNLDYGDYKVVIKGPIQKRFQEQEVIAFKILPPIYLTEKAKWFYLVMVLCLIILFVRAYAKYKETLQRENEKRVQDKLHALKDSSEMMEQMLQTKNDAMARISHEIRTPLMLVTEPLKNIAMLTDNQEILEDIDLVKRNAQRVSTLVEQLLEIERLSSIEQVPLHKYDIEPFCAFLVESIRPIAEQKQQSIKMSLRAKGDIYLIQDTLQQIFYNLLSNAVKYSPEGSEISVTTKIDREHLLIQVKDQGPGLNEVEMASIFNRFSRLEKGNKQQGLGLGLSLLKQLVKANQGHIEVTSETGAGACFAIRLPLEQHGKQIQLNVDDKSSRTSTDAEVSSLVTSESTLPILLIADDSPELRSHLCKLFQAHFTCIAVKNGQEALRAVHTLKPDLLLTDNAMPLMTGIELVTEIRKDPKFQHMIIFMLSGIRDSESVKQGHDAKLDDYIFKPFDQDILKQKVLNRWSQRQTTSSKSTKENSSLFLGITPQLENEKDQSFYLNLATSLHKHYREPEFTRSTCASELFVSERQLNRKLQSILHLSFNDMLKKYRVDQAKQELMKGCSVTDTAYNCGFSNPSYFSTAFKSETGMSPSEFVRQGTDSPQAAQA